MVGKIFFTGFLLSFWGYTCSHQENTSWATPGVTGDTLQTATVDFARDIKPIMQSNCTPCHFPGGTMYAKMPFDNPRIIRDHSAGILRRIKGEEEVKKLKAFLATEAAD